MGISFEWFSGPQTGSDDEDEEESGIETGPKPDRLKV